MEYPKALYRSAKEFTDGNELLQALKDRHVEHMVVLSRMEEDSYRLNGFRNFGDWLKPDDVKKVVEETEFPESAKVLPDGSLEIEKSDGTLETKENASPYLLGAQIEIPSPKRRGRPPLNKPVPEVVLPEVVLPEITT